MIQVAVSPLQVLEGTLIIPVGQSEEEKSTSFSRFEFALVSVFSPP